MLLENPGRGGTINHLGVEVESTDTVHSGSPASLGGLFTEEGYEHHVLGATQDKVWVTGPAEWEVYTRCWPPDASETAPTRDDIEQRRDLLRRISPQALTLHLVLRMTGVFTATARIPDCSRDRLGDEHDIGHWRPAAVVEKLSRARPVPPVWIGIAMATGLLAALSLV